jgi:hypothetical protein
MGGMSRAIRRLATFLNPFQPVRGDFTAPVFITTVAAWTLGSGIYGGRPGSIALGAAESLICPLGPLAYGLYRRVRG